MLNQKIEDRYGNELTVGSEVLYAEYDRDSSLYEGIILEFRKNSVIVSKKPNWTRVVKIKDVKEKLILNPYNK